MTTDERTTRRYRHPDGIAVIVVPTGHDLDVAAADFVSARVSGGEAATIAFPTGGTPVGMYRELVGQIRAGTLSFDGVVFFQLDEFRGLTLGDPDSFATWLRRHLLDPAGVEAARFHLVPSLASDPTREGEAYEVLIDRSGGLDLAVLGIGDNGHVAFNEPGSAADSRTRALKLSDETIEQTERTWTGTIPVPREAVTMGVGTLLGARQSLMLAKGGGKADVVRRALLEPQSTETPASFMRRAGERFTIVLDRDAAAKIEDALATWPQA